MLLDYMFYWKDINKLIIKTISFTTKSCPFKRPFGNLGIGIVIGISIGIGIAKILFLLSEVFLKKYSIFVLSCAQLWYQYHFATNTYFSTILIHPSKGIHWCSRKRLFEFWEASLHWCFEKITTSKILAYFLAKHLGWSPLRSFQNFFEKLFRVAVL